MSSFSPFHLIILMPVLLVSMALYFLPSIVAKAREHPQFVFILVVNLLFGWSGVGWIGCLVWSLVTPSRPRPGA